MEKISLNETWRLYFGIEGGDMYIKRVQTPVCIMMDEIGGVHYGNHYISGYVPYEFGCYKSWLEKIRQLPQPFEVEPGYK